MVVQQFELIGGLDILMKLQHHNRNEVYRWAQKILRKHFVIDNEETSFLGL